MGIVRQTYVRAKLPVAAPPKETTEEYHQRWQAIVDARPVRAGCLFCDWTLEATAGECRAAALEHRRVEHPETLRKQASKRKKRRFNSTNVTEEQEDQMTADRLRRMRLLGIPP